MQTQKKHEWQFLSSCLLLGMTVSLIGFLSVGAQGDPPPKGTQHLWQQLPDPFKSGGTATLFTVAVSPSGVIYAGGKGGVSRSYDGGNHWTVINNGLPANQWVMSLGFNAFDEPIAGVGDNPAVGVFRYSGGQWHQASGISANLFISDIKSDNAGNILAVTAWAGDVYRSTDDGNTFTQIATSVGGGGALWTIAKAPDGSLYTGGELTTGIFHSVDGGYTWQAVGLSNSAGYTGNLFAIGFANNALFAARTASSGAVMQRYSAGTWTSASTGLPAWYKVRTVLANRKGELFASLLRDLTSTQSYGGVFISTDNGQSWQNYSTGLPHCDMEKMAIGRGGHLFVIANNGANPSLGGLYKSVYVP